MLLGIAETAVATVEPTYIFGGLPFGSWADWIVALATTTAAIVAWVQLRRVVEASRQQANVARAELILKIDQIFEGAEMAQSRLAVRTLRNQCEAVARRKDPDADLARIFRDGSELFSQELTRLYRDYKTADMPPPAAADADLTRVPKDAAGERYAALMHLPYWAETIGFLVRKGLMKREDVLDLYDAVFTETLVCFQQHITYRREDKPFGNSFFMEHMLWFLEEAKTHRAQGEKRA